MLEMAWAIIVIGFVSLVVLVVMLFCMCTFALDKDNDTDGQ